MMISLLLTLMIMNENLNVCIMMYRMATPNGMDCCNDFILIQTTNQAKQIIENAASDTFKAPCCCFENAPNTALTIVCAINMSIDCNWFDVPNHFARKNILK